MAAADHVGDHPGPSGLVRGAEPGAVVAVEVLVEQQLVEDLAQEVQVAATVDGEHLERGSRLHRGVHVGEIPLIGGQRPVRVLEPLPGQAGLVVVGESKVEDAIKNAVTRAEKETAQELDVDPKDLDKALQQAVKEM